MFFQISDLFASVKDEDDAEKVSYTSVFDTKETYLDSSRRHPLSPTIRISSSAFVSVDQITQKLGATSLSHSHASQEINLTPKLVNTLYSAIPASYAGQLLCFSVSLDQFRMDQLNRLGISLNRLTQVTRIQLLKLQNGTSCKFNVIFPFISELFEKNLILELTYFAAGTQPQVAANNGFIAMQQTVPGSILTSPPSTKHRGIWGLKSPVQPAHNIFNAKTVTEFADHTEDMLEFQEDQEYLSKWDSIWGTTYFGISNLDDYIEYDSAKADLTPSEWLKVMVALTPNVKAIDFTCASITDAVLSDMIESLNGFSALVVLNLSSNAIHPEIYENLRLIIQQAQFKFINLQHTDFSEALMENFELFKARMPSEDFDLFVQKAIWLDSDQSLFDEELKKLPSEYHRQVRNAHNVYKKVEDWLIHISNRRQAREELKGAIEIKKETK